MRREIKKMIESKSVVYHFNSLHDMAEYIEKTRPVINTDISIVEVDPEYDTYYGTANFKEAATLMKDGWSTKSETMAEHIDSMFSGYKMIARQRYDVIGGQASVPRYLQGIPTDMIRTDRMPVKEKVVKVYKSLAYNCDITNDRIEYESERALALIKRLESSGIRCELYTVITLSGIDRLLCPMGEYIDIMVKVKASGERLNISKVAYPLVHPSFVRRHIMAIVERDDVVDQQCFCARCYGIAIDDDSACDRSGLYLPAMIPDAVMDAKSVEEIKEILK